MNANDIGLILSDKTQKPKRKTELLASLLLKRELSLQVLLAIASAAKDPVKATCVEAVEFASKQQPDLVDIKSFQYFISCLSSKAPRVKWEAAKVIANTVHLHRGEIPEAVKHLLNNTKDKGTVVRWSAAMALGEILKLKSPVNKELLPAFVALAEKEEKNSIKKIYLAVLKQMNLK